VAAVTDGSGDAGRSVDTRQVGLVAVAVLGLLVAALLVPAAGGGARPGSGPAGNDTRTPDGTPGDGAEGPSLPGGWLRWLVDLVEPGGDPSPEPTATDEPRCVVTFDRPPEPGATVTVTVLRSGKPAADVPVWFEDDRIGRTDAAGRVDGEVPYVRALTVRVGVRGGPDCVAETSTRADAAVRSPHRPDGGRSDPVAATIPVGVAAAQPENASVEVDIRGEMRLAAVREAYPGTDVQVRATIGDRPVPDADVTVDGDVVAATDDDGTATVTVPDDGRQAVELGATRGEFEATADLDVLVLAVGLEPASGLAVVPDTDATAVATLGDGPAEDAAVSVAGRERGRTNGTGRLDVALPADPRATVRVETTNQTATTSVTDHYAVPAAVLALLSTVVVGVTAWRRGRRSAATAVAAIGAGLAVIVAILVVDAHDGPTARNAVVLALALVATAIILRRRRAAVGTAATGIRRGFGHVGGRLRALVATLRKVPLSTLLARVRERLLAAALRTATLLAGAVARLRRSLARFRPFRLSRGGLRVAVRRRLRRLAAAVTARRVASLVGGSLALAVAVLAGDRTAGERGAVVAAVAGVLLAVSALWLRRRRAGGEATTDGAADPAATGAAAGVPGSAQDPRGRRSLRAVWRAFARAVSPARWRTSAPSEVARAAVEQGFPRRPVEELTTLFREVEYGGRPLTDAVRDRAATAYDAIRGAVGEGEDA
jgi:hypothetical protein